MKFHALKEKIATVFDAVGLLGLACTIERKVNGHTIRVLNYHGTPESNLPQFEAQLKYFSKHYSSATIEDVEAVIAGKAASRNKPGLVLTFDDGLANNLEVAAPILEKYGFIGWFFVPAAFLDVTLSDQGEFLAANRIGLDSNEQEEALTKKISLSRDQVRQLADKHLLGSHTTNHTRLSKNLSPAQLREEIHESKIRLEQLLDKEVSCFSWVGGQEQDYSSSAATEIRAAGYKYSVMTNSHPVRRSTNRMQIQRTHIESGWELPLVKMQLCGVIDWIYSAKRKRVNRITGEAYS